MTATLDNLAGHDCGDTQKCFACEVPNSLDGQATHDAHDRSVVEGPRSATDQSASHAQMELVGGGPNPPDGQEVCETQWSPAVGGLISGSDQTCSDTHAAPVAAALARPAPATTDSTPSGVAPVLDDFHHPRWLAFNADILDDLERVRIANENRLRQLTRAETDSDGEERGFGLTLDHPAVARTAAIVEALGKIEHQAELELARTLRRHQLGPWVKQAHGIGPKQGARLLAAIGDPYWNTLHDRPRTVSELWAYCGYHVLRTGQVALDTQDVDAGSDLLPAGQTPIESHRGSASGTLSGGNPDHAWDDAQCGIVGVAAHRARGAKANWSAAAKMRARLVAVSIVKAGGPYREVYDQAREKYDGALHQVECKRCGPKNKPAPVGSPLSPGHQHARALRIVAKTVLRDLWREAKRLHDIHDGQSCLDTQGAVAVVDPTPELHDGHAPSDAHGTCAVVEPISDIHDGQPSCGTHESPAVVDPNPPEETR